MGMKLKDFIKDDNLQLSENRIEQLLNEIFGEPSLTAGFETKQKAAEGMAKLMVKYG